MVAPSEVSYRHRVRNFHKYWRSIALHTPFISLKHMLEIRSTLCSTTELYTKSIQPGMFHMITAGCYGSLIIFY